MNNYIIYVVGATNTGKTTLLEKVKEKWPELVHLIQVGKILRSKYPPEYFEGQAAPSKTQEEAIQLVLDGIKAGENKQFILVDGQPRDTTQADTLCQLPTFRDQIIIELVAPREIRVKRAEARDTGSKLELSLQRMDKDILCTHEVRVACIQYNMTWISVDTSLEEYDPTIMFSDIIQQIEGQSLLHSTTDVVDNQ
jgi:adenylate kinase family enzyme